MDKRLKMFPLLFSLSCPGHPEPARCPDSAPAPHAEIGADINITVDDCRAVPARSRKSIVANGDGRRRRPVEPYATAIAHTKEPNA